MIDNYVFKIEQTSRNRISYSLVISDRGINVRTTPHMMQMVSLALVRNLDAVIDCT